MHLVPQAGDTAKLQQVPTRDGFGEGLVAAAEADPRIVGLCADLTESTRMLPFKKAFPERFVQMGVHEQLLAASAAGMALAGKVPFIASYAVFCPGRAWEQVRTNLCLNEANVKIAGAHAGVSVGPDGATHQALEDIAIMRVLPRMTVVVPCDAPQAKKATEAVAAWDGPCYLRLGREKSPVVTTADTPFVIGKAQVFREGADVVIFACGLMVPEALAAAEQLTRGGIDAAVVNVHTVKPLDEDAIAEWASRCGAVVTAEEHQVAGGMGSAIAEALAQRRPVPMEFVGVRDQFGQSGTPEELLAHYGLTATHIADAAKRAMARK
jgi:transketolase